MQGLRFLREEFYFLQGFKHALPIIDKKIARQRCKVYVFYAKNLRYYSVLNTLYQSLIKSLRVKDARSSLLTQIILICTAFSTRSTNHWLKICTWKMQGLPFLRVLFYALMECDFQKNHLVSLLCASYNALFNELNIAKHQHYVIIARFSFINLTVNF